MNIYSSKNNGISLHVNEFLPRIIQNTKFAKKNLKAKQSKKLLF